MHTGSNHGFEQEIDFKNGQGLYSRMGGKGHVMLGFEPIMQLLVGYAVTRNLKSTFNPVNLVECSSL